MLRWPYKHYSRPRRRVRHHPSELQVVVTMDRLAGLQLVVDHDTPPQH